MSPRNIKQDKREKKTKGRGNKAAEYENNKKTEMKEQRRKKKEEN
jgi:hypothetical protein